MAPGRSRSISKTGSPPERSRRPSPRLDERTHRSRRPRSARLVGAPGGRGVVPVPRRHLGGSSVEGGRHAVRPGRHRCADRVPVAPGLRLLSLLGRARFLGPHEPDGKLAAAPAHSRSRPGRAGRRCAQRSRAGVRASRRGGGSRLRAARLADPVAYRTSRLVLGLLARLFERPDPLLRPNDIRRDSCYGTPRRSRGCDGASGSRADRRPRGTRSVSDEGDRLPFRGVARATRSRAREATDRAADPHACRVGRRGLGGRYRAGLALQRHSLRQCPEHELPRARAPHARHRPDPGVRRRPLRVTEWRDARLLACGELHARDRVSSSARAPVRPASRPPSGPRPGRRDRRPDYRICLVVDALRLVRVWTQDSRFPGSCRWS